MNVRTIGIVGLAVVCGFSAVVLVQGLARPQAGPVVQRAPVVFAIADIRPGETIDAPMLEVRQIPKDQVPDDAIAEIPEVVDRAAQVPIDKGDPIRRHKLAEKGAGRGMAALIRPGMRAFTIQTASLSSSMAGFVLPGNRVDVLLTVSNTGASEEDSGTTTTILQNAEVLAVHTTVNTPTSNKIDPNEARSVTLLVTPKEAAALDLGQNKGTLHLSLRNLKDTDTTGPDPATVADLHLPRPRKPEAPPPAVTPAPAPSPTVAQADPAEVAAELRQVVPQIRTLRGTAAGWDTLTLVGRTPRPDPIAPASALNRPAPPVAGLDRPGRLRP